MQTSVRQGVILAAGRGTRLQPLTDIGPKPLHPICNKPIMQYQMEAMRDAGILDICIVIGPTSQAICDYFGDGSRLGLCVTYIEDPAPQGIAASLACTEPWVDGPFIVFLGDIFLALNDLTPALAPMDDGAAGTLIMRRDTPDAIRRNFAVIFDKAGRVSRVIEKPDTPPNEYKGCGVYVFDQTIFDAIRRTPRSLLRNEYEITDAVQALIDMGRPIYTADVVRWDVNITYPGDLLDCNMRMLREQQLDSLVGQASWVHEQAQLSSSIVGDGAVMNTPAKLEECLVLPDTRVDYLGGIIRRHIFASGFMWYATGSRQPSLYERAVGG
jgi:dTDP-glucose pyrophosphorylase